MKHIAIDFPFVRDQLSCTLLRISHAHTTDQLDVSLTKPLARKQFLIDHLELVIILNSYHYQELVVIYKFSYYWDFIYFFKYK